ncbi:MAG: homoprotocatechuate degradation operon regulator HpaR [Pseudomonadota bacterium]
MTQQTDTAIKTGPPAQRPVQRPARPASSSKLRPTARSLPIALLRARETVMEPIRDMLHSSGISEQKWRILRVLDEAGPLEQTVIAHSCCLMVSSLTRLLTAMQAEGLLTRADDERDRRKTIVTVTDSGRRLIHSHADQSRAIFARLETRYGADRLETLLDLLEDMQALDLKDGNGTALDAYKANGATQ